jgi:hypothetical protein
MRYFAWLVEEYGFSVIHSESGPMGYCGFTLQSGDCRLSMSVERGYAQFGQLALVPAAKQLDALTPESRWYYVGEIIDYLRGSYLSWPEIEERNRLFKGLSEEESMADLSAECRISWPRIMMLFQEDEFKRRQEELEEFLHRKDEDLHTQSMIISRRREMEWLKRGQNLQYQQELEECIRDMGEKTGEEFDKTQVKWLELVQKANKDREN